MTRKFPELITGLIVIAVAVIFLVYALGQANIGSGGGYPLKAQFSSVGGLTVGSDVKIGGIVVGRVATETLDPQTYAAVVTLSMNPGVKVPEDSSASISSDGLLGGVYVSLSPGGSDTMLKSGQSFTVTQSAINIEDLLGKFIFSMGNTGSSGSSAAKPASGQSGAATPPASANPASPANIGAPASQGGTPQ